MFRPVFRVVTRLEVPPARGRGYACARAIPLRALPAPRALKDMCYSFAHHHSRALPRIKSCSHEVPRRPRTTLPQPPPQHTRPPMSATESYSLAPTPGGALFRCSPDDPVYAAAGLVLIEYETDSSSYVASADGKRLLTATTLAPVLEWLRAITRAITTLQRELVRQVERVAAAEAAAPGALSLPDVCADVTHVVMQELGAVRDFEPTGTSMGDQILTHCDYDLPEALTYADTLLQLVSAHGLTHGLSQVAPMLIGCLEPRER